MVDKIIIRPNEVRGLGDIISTKAGTDFTTTDCNIIQGIDRVNGSNEKVFNINDDILFKDWGVTPVNNTEDWYYNSDNIRLTVGSQYSYITHITTDSVQVFIANNPGTPAGDYDYAPPFAVEFDLVGYTADSAANIQVYDGTNNAYRRFDYMGLTNNELHHIRVLALDDKVEFYADGELKYTADYTMSTSRTALRVGANGDYIRFRNFTVRQLE